MKRFAIVAAMFAAACGYSEDKFADEAAEATCAVIVNCTESEYADVDACLADSPGGDDDNEPACDDESGYDSDAAQACVDALNAIADSCPADPADFFPAVCADVCGDTDADTGMDSDSGM